MSIPTGPYPAVIDRADILAGMHIRFTAQNADSQLVFTGSVVDINASTVTVSAGVNGTSVLSFADFIDKLGDSVCELLEAFGGNPVEPSVGSVVQAADGTVYQRSPLPSNPTASIWHPMGLTTVVNWATITTSGAPTLLLDGSTQ